MSDFDRMLGDSLKSIKEEHMAEIAPKVPAARRRFIERLSARRRFFFRGGFAIAAAALAATVFVVSTAPVDDRTAPEPPAGKNENVPSPGETTGIDEARERCLTRINFEPTHIPRGMSPTAGVGSGGQRNVPLRDQDPTALIHYSASEESYIDVVTHGSGIAPEVAWQIDVLGAAALIASIEGGMWVSFRHEGCSYELLASGLEEGQVRRFAEGLVPSGQGNLTYDAFALWPESVPEHAYEGCLDSGPQFSAFRRSAAATAKHFAVSELAWPQPVFTEGPVYNLGHDYEAMRVARDDGPGAPAVDLMLREVAADCWSVSSVSGTQKRKESFLSVSKRGTLIQVNFDMSAHVDAESVANIEITSGFDHSRTTRSISVEEFRKADGIELNLREDTLKPTSFLIRLLDPEGQVVGAIGRPLPSGDFAAG